MLNRTLCPVTPGRHFAISNEGHSPVLYWILEADGSPDAMVLLQDGLGGIGRLIRAKQLTNFNGFFEAASSSEEHARESVKLPSRPPPKLPHSIQSVPTPQRVKSAFDIAMWDHLSVNVTVLITPEQTMWDAMVSDPTGKEHDPKDLEGFVQSKMVATGLPLKSFSGRLERFADGQIQFELV